MDGFSENRGGKIIFMGAGACQRMNYCWRMTLRGEEVQILPVLLEKEQDEGKLRLYTAGSAKASFASPALHTGVEIREVKACL